MRKYGIQDFFVLPVQGKSEMEKGRKFLKAHDKKLTKGWDEKCPRYIWANLLVGMLTLYPNLSLINFKPIQKPTSKEACFMFEHCRGAVSFSNRDWQALMRWA